MEECSLAPTPGDSILQVHGQQRTIEVSIQKQSSSNSSDESNDGIDEDVDETSCQQAAFVEEVVSSVLAEDDSSPHH